MSFVSSNKGGKKSRKSTKRPDWDPSINDLTEFKATPEEIERRREAHRSKNLELVRQSAIEKRIAKARREAALSDSTNNYGVGNAFLREILYSSSDATRLMEDTQKAIQVAQDIFGEDAKKYRAIPAVTALESDDEENAVYTRPILPDGLIKTVNESQTRLEKLSNSVMKKTALNETYSASSTEESESEDDEENKPPREMADKNDTPISFPTRLDLQRFQRLLEQEELSSIAASEASNKQDTKLEKEINQVKEMNSSKRKASKKSKPASETSNDLRAYLDRLEKSLNDYESKFGAADRDMNSTCSTNSSDNISNYTLSLLTGLHRMMNYFNQIQESLIEEKRQRSVKEKQILDLTNRADLLTSELIQTQEQFHVVLDELNRVKNEHRHEIDQLKATVVKISKGQVVHTVEVDQPRPANLTKLNSKGTGPAVTFKKTASPVTVITHAEFEKSPENQKLLNQSKNHIERTDEDDDEGRLSANGDSKEHVITEEKPVQQAALSSDDMTLEQRIEQLRDDHRLTLERFRKLGMELQKSGISESCPGWVVP